MLLNDTVSHRQAQARTATDAFGSEKWIVDFRNVLRRDAHPTVGDLDQQRPLVVSFARGQGDAAVAIGDRIARVEDQVGKYLLQLNGVAMNLREVLCIIAHDLDIAAPQLRLEQLQRVVQHTVNIDSGKLSRTTCS